MSAATSPEHACPGRASSDPWLLSPTQPRASHCWSAPRRRFCDSVSRRRSSLSVFGACAMIDPGAPGRSLRGGPAGRATGRGSSQAWAARPARAPARPRARRLMSTIWLAASSSFSWGKVTLTVTGTHAASAIAIPRTPARRPKPILLTVLTVGVGSLWRWGVTSSGPTGRPRAGSSHWGRERSWRAFAKALPHAWSCRSPGCCSPS